MTIHRCAMRSNLRSKTVRVYFYYGQGIPNYGSRAREIIAMLGLKFS